MSAALALNLLVVAVTLMISSADASHDLPASGTIEGVAGIYRTDITELMAAIRPAPELFSGAARVLQGRMLLATQRTADLMRREHIELRQKTATPETTVRQRAKCKRNLKAQLAGGQTGQNVMHSAPASWQFVRLGEIVDTTTQYRHRD